MLSMTGFGHAEKSLDQFDIGVDVRTVNSRYLDIVLRVPKEISFLEPRLRKEVQSRLRRGRVEVYLNLTLKSGDQYQLDGGLVANYLSLARQAQELGVPGELDVQTLFQMPGVVAAREIDLRQTELVETIVHTVGEALDKAMELRRAEGELLKRELMNRTARLTGLVETIAGYARQILQYYRQALQQRVEELGAQNVVDPNRLAQEVIFYAERSDIAEEITRLQSHLEQFRRYLEDPEEQEVGRRLDFLCQEMNREINTILSKSPLAEISEKGVAAKAEIEKMREQVQNVQ